MILIIIENIETGADFINVLNEKNFKNLIIAAPQPELVNLKGFRVTKVIQLENVSDWFKNNSEELDFVFDLCGNDKISKTLWSFCASNQVPIVYVDTDKEFEDWAKLQNSSPFYWKRLSPKNRDDIAFNELIAKMIHRH